MRRFYQRVSTSAVDGGFAVRLDDRLLHTPGRRLLMVPTIALAEEIAKEWVSQADEIKLAGMPMNALANAAIDLVMPNPTAFAEPIASYGETDLLCYRAPDPQLAAQQAKLWNPVMAWAEQHWTVEFTIASGIMHVAQPAETVAALARATRQCDAYTLAAMSPLVTIGGSLIAALALIHDAFGPEELWTALTLDEYWQEARWGAVDDAVEARAARQREWLAADRFRRLARG